MFKFLKKNMVYILGGLIFFFILSIPIFYGSRSFINVGQSQREVVLDKETMVAAVNGKGISRERFYALVNNFLTSLNSNHPQRDYFRMARFVQPTVLEELIGFNLLVENARENKLKIKNSEIDEEIKRMMEENKLKNKKELKDFLKRRGQTFENFRKNIKDIFLYRKMIEEIKKRAIVTDDEVKAKYPHKLPKDLNKAKEDLLRAKEDEEYYRWFNNLRSGAKVEIFDPLLLAFQQEKEGKLKEALLSYQQALSSNPANPYFDYYLGQIYERLGDKSNAESEYRKAIVKAELNPAFSDPYFYIALGDFYRQRKSSNFAAENYQKAASIAGEEISMLLALKSSFEQLGLFKEAKAQQVKIDKINKAQKERDKK